MYIKKLKIENFRGIREMEIDFHKQMNVVIGINGAGKSSVLDALGYLLTPPVDFFSFRTAGMREFAALISETNDFPDHEIHNDMRESNLELTFAQQGLEDKSWQLHSSNIQQVADGKAPSRTRFNIFDYSIWKPYFVYGDESNLSTCLIVYYRARREVDNIYIDAWTSRNFRKQDAFVDALAPRIDFKEFSEWFRNREDLENEERAGGKNEPDRLLESVRMVIGAFLNTVTDVRIRRRDPLRMVVTKNDRELRIEQLSDGEKCLLAMVGDLARRMAIANPSLDNPLHGEGVVLIDEVDLHLHPQWQRMILPRLMETFPNCQFIVSTHSPQIIGELKSEYITRLEETESGIKAIPANGETFGMTSNMILETQMDSTERNREIQDMLEDAFRSVEQGNLERAKEITDL